LKNSHIIVTIGILFILPSICFSYGYYDAFGNGTAYSGINSRSVSLAGLRSLSITDPSVIFLNPAELGLLHSMEITFSAGPIVWKEKVADSLWGDVKTGTFLGILSGAFSKDLGDRMTFGAGLSRISNNDYEGVKLTIIDPSQVEEIDIAEIVLASGGLWEAVGGLSWQVNKNLLFGASAGVRFGSMKAEYIYDLLATQGIDSLITEEWEEKEFCYHLGVMIPGEDAALGICYASGSEHYDPIIAAGARIRVEYLNNGDMGFEIEMSSRSDADWYTGRLFADVPFSRRINTHYGLTFTDSNNSFKTGLGFSLGGSFRFEKTLMSFGYYWSTRSRLGGSFANESAHHMDDSSNILSLGLSFILGGGSYYEKEIPDYTVHIGQ
jgi:hypothetical protein